MSPTVQGVIVTVLCMLLIVAVMEIRRLVRLSGDTPKVLSIDPVPATPLLPMYGRENQLLDMLDRQMSGAREAHLETVRALTGTLASTTGAALPKIAHDAQEDFSKGVGEFEQHQLDTAVEHVRQIYIGSMMAPPSQAALLKEALQFLRGHGVEAEDYQEE